MDNESSPKGFSAWQKMGTKRDYANMLNEKPVSGNKKKRKSSTHWEFPTKLKLKGF